VNNIEIHRPAAAVVLFFLLLGPISIAAAQPHTENVLLVTFDGLRYQDLLSGADEKLLTKDAGGVLDEKITRERFWRDSPEARRRVLLPFLWDTVIAKGQLFGDPAAQSEVRVTNGKFFSYPGYQEILCGFADERIVSNAKIPNRNVTVLEWLHGRDGFDGRVAAFCSWDVFPFIINQKRSGIPVNAGWEPLGDLGDAQTNSLVAEMEQQLPRFWHNVRYDVFTYRGAEAHVRRVQPRLLYVAFGETDDWAHAGRYDLYLDAAQRTDQYIRRLWEQMQSMQQYAQKTSLVIATDHGRGDTREGWKNHSAQLPGSEYIWIAAMGPDTPATGVRENVSATQGQVAATVAALLGHDYIEFAAEAAGPLPGITTESAPTQ
jgi:hypothetical protein